MPGLTACIVGCEESMANASALYCISEVMSYGPLELNELEVSMSKSGLVLQHPGVEAAQQSTPGGIVDPGSQSGLRFSQAK
jgi:hypothetical protein